jgi:hypothetical protein
LQITNHQLQIQSKASGQNAVRKRFGYLEAGVARLKLGVVWRREAGLVALETRRRGSEKRRRSALRPYKKTKTLEN